LAEEWWARAMDEVGAAKSLRSTGKNWAQIYQHAGFAVELMLKAIRIKNLGLEAWPAADKGNKWHDLKYAAEQAGIMDDLRAACRGNISLEAYWLTVKDWDNQSRYPGGVPSELDAKELLLAVINPTNGVMKWLQQTYQKI
jgi:HEPN domain-containing protein